MFTYARLCELSEVADCPVPDLDLVQARNNAVSDYIEAFVEHAPRNDMEAGELFTLAEELAPELEPVRQLTCLSGRTTEALVILRRLAKEASLQEDPCDPPLRHAERAMHTLIAWMSKPVLLSE